MFCSEINFFEPTLLLLNAVQIRFVLVEYTEQWKQAHISLMTCESMSLLNKTFSVACKSSELAPLVENCLVKIEWMCVEGQIRDIGSQHSTESEWILDVSFFHPFFCPFSLSPVFPFRPQICQLVTNCVFMPLTVRFGRRIYRHFGNLLHNRISPIQLKAKLCNSNPKLRCLSVAVCKA